MLKGIRVILAFVLLLSACVPLKSQIALGKWREHLSYSKLTHVEEAGDRIYGSSESALFYYDLDEQSTTSLSKTNLLSDVGISTFAFDPQTKSVVVAYTNSNIDIISDDRTFNINDIKRSNIGGDKRINNISFNDRKVYLSCGFGIVVLDTRRVEISETFYLGSEGGMMNVNDVAFNDSLIVAATDNGLYMAPKNSQMLSIVTTWHIDNSSLIAGQRVTQLAVDGNGKVLALVQNGDDTTLYREVSQMTFAPMTTGRITGFRVCNDRVVVCKDNSVELYGSDGVFQKSFSTVEDIDITPHDAILGKDGRLWVAHDWASLISFNLDGTSLKYVNPGGPWTSNAYTVDAYDSVVYLSPGGHRTTYEGTYKPAEVYIFKNDEWRLLKDPNNYLRGKNDILQTAVNPTDRNQVLASTWGSGILEITGDEATNFYDDSNSDGAIVRFSQGDYNTVLTGGIAFDRKGNAWITNSLVDAALVVRYKDGSWKNYNTMGVVSSDIDKIIWDSISDMKLFWGRQNKVFVHDGESRLAYIDPNNGAKLQTATVNCLVQDHNGQLWMGTNKGIKVIYSLAKVFDGGGNGEASPVACNNILFNENGITEYLMAYESVTCIAVDGANRKWVGTSTGGLYLLSANGLQQLEHFTSADSPLFSDKILSLAIMPWSGELFVVTDKGVQSYRASATYAFGSPLEDIHAFPNPVRPDYDGLIAIKGFSRNAIVHITDAAGNTVYSTKSDGGQAVWDGRNHEGKKVASGVYYVFASSEDGSVRSATKILVVR